MLSKELLQQIQTYLQITFGYGIREIRQYPKAYVFYAETNGREDPAYAPLVADAQKTGVIYLLNDNISRKYELEGDYEIISIPREYLL